MAQLRDMACVACRKGAPKLSNQEIEEFSRQLPGWEVVTEGDVPRFQKQFSFEDFSSALDFTVRIGTIADESGHHPEIVTAWGAVTLRWWTHKIGGLHLNDAVMAARSDEEYRSFSA